jgi:uncharacterized protein (TIGR02246 family)
MLSSALRNASEADKSAVARLARGTLAAWSWGDAEAFANYFTEDGIMILPGVFCHGREEIRAFMAATFPGDYGGTLATGQSLDLRFLGSDVALLVTEGGVIAPGDTEVTSERAIRASWLAVRCRGQWRLGAYQNTPRTQPAVQGKGKSAADGVEIRSPAPTT